MSKLSETSLYTLFPILCKNGNILYYCCDFSEELGGSVYKGYLCHLIKPEPTNISPRRVKKEELNIAKDQPVAIKLYDGQHQPSRYQYYASKLAVLNTEGRAVLIMKFIDGFHIFPDARDNPQLRQLTFFQAVDVAWQLILGLNHLHYNNSSGPSIVHGDIKGENIKIQVNEMNINDEKKYKVDVSFLDLDYAKPISSSLQRVQGTPEHIAIEVLNGVYSEASDFYALTPLLLSIFGARNPMDNIIAFRNNHLEMRPDKLIRKFCDISFCSEGLFEHFKTKPDPTLCQLVEQFIMKMGKKNKVDRPSPSAILEFFTGLRQHCLVEEVGANPDIYLLRLYIAAQNEEWLKDKKYHTLFFNLDKSLQDRFIALMSPNQCILLYKIAEESRASALIVSQLRKIIANYLEEQTHSFENSCGLSSFFSPISRHDIQWLLRCFKDQDCVNYNSPKYEKRRKILENCSNKELAQLISIVTKGIVSSTPCDPPSIRP